MSLCPWRFKRVREYCLLHCPRSWHWLNMLRHLAAAPLLVPVVCGQRVCAAMFGAAPALSTDSCGGSALPLRPLPGLLCCSLCFSIFFSARSLALLSLFPLLLFFFKFPFRLLCRFLIFFSFLRSSCYRLFLCQNLF